MKKWFILIVLLIVGALCIPAVSAEEIYNEVYTEKSLDMIHCYGSGYVGSAIVCDRLMATSAFKDSIIIGVISQLPAENVRNYYTSVTGSPQLSQSDSSACTLTFDGQTIGSGTVGYFKYSVGNSEYLQIYLDIDYIDTSEFTHEYNVIYLDIHDDTYAPPVIRGRSGGPAGSDERMTDSPGYFMQWGTGTGEIGVTANTYVALQIAWSNQLIVETFDIPTAGSKISFIKNIDLPDYPQHTSIHAVTYNGTTYTGTGDKNEIYYVYPESYPFSVGIQNPLSGTWYNKTFGELPTPTPTPTLQQFLRTGTVTMTDHNGTTISGFDVRAVNHYTGEEYTISTDSDVATITLPMDRTVEIRNPQTGVYEEAPIGYYRFYGQKPGYKMLNEEGIKVSVMPEKYGSYKLCDIGVTSDSGPLTGKHQFQLRSWSDNSILQTGTISAKSRTTGIWYNATVVNGLATLILPYDTSDAISEHAGHYYVYATSPGYEDIDYGVQITVYPHTVSEIRSIHLTPIGGVPTPGNVTLRIQAISETGQGVPNAEIFIAGVLGAGDDVWDTYTTSWTGFLEVSVPGNSTYDIVARGAGYHDSSRRVQVFTEDPPIIEMYLFLSGAPTIEPTTEPTGWVTGPPTTQPTGGIPDEDDGSGGFLMEAVRGIANLFGVSFGIGKTILGMLLALGVGTATAKQLKGGAQEFGMGMLGGVVLGVLIGLLPIWVLVLLVLIVGLWIGQRYMSGGDS